MQNYIEVNNEYLWMTIDTYNVFDYDDNEMDFFELEWDYDDYEWKYDKEWYILHLARCLVHCIKDNLVGDVILWVLFLEKRNKDGKLTNPRSPQYYNYSTDNINLHIEYDFNKLVEFCDCEWYDNYLDEEFKDNLWYKKGTWRQELDDPDDSVKYMLWYYCKEYADKDYIGDMYERRNTYDYISYQKK